MSLRVVLWFLILGILNPPGQGSGSPSSGIRHDWVLGEVPLGTEGGKLEACLPRQAVGRERQGESRGGRVSGSLPRPYAFPRLVGAGSEGSFLLSSSFPKVGLAFGLREQSGWAWRGPATTGCQAQEAGWDGAKVSEHSQCLQAASPGTGCGQEMVVHSSVLHYL